VRSLIISTAHQYCLGDLIEKNEMGETYCANEVEAYTGFGWGSLRE
jgi:hypothetical protein